MAKRETPKQIIDRISAWMKTPAGQRKLRASARRAEATVKRLEKASRVDPKKLTEPFTI